MINSKPEYTSDLTPRILIVDDEPKNHVVYRKILSTLDIEIEEAHSGQQALRVAHQQDFCLILMDVQMPGMDGFETASLILDHPKTQHIPVMFVTALAKDEIFRYKGYASGAVDYLTKPINEDILKSKISVFVQLWHKRHLLELKNEELLTLNRNLNETAAALSKARVAAELAAKAKSNFLSTMSHEIRTPMNAVIGTIQLLRKTDMSDYQAKLLDNISYGGKTLMVIIDDILDLSKIEAGKIALEHIAFNLMDLLARAIDTFSPTANEKGITLKIVNDSETDGSPEQPIFVKGDPTRITQVINNLLSNAIKFTKEGGVTLSFKPISTQNETISFDITVRDTGIGISESQLSHLFSAFNQADSCTARLYGGTGLGLSISKGLVEVMAGKITAQSTLNQGSQFTVSLTLAVANANELPKIQAPSKTTKRERTANILVVDDIETNLCIAQFLLEEEGHTVTTATNGHEAIKVFTDAGDTLDIILMDIQMPGMDGYEAAKEIRRIELQSDSGPVPIIALTADVLTKTREKCVDVGMNGFLNKPIEETQLLELIQHHLSF